MSRREPPAISEQQLYACLEDEYHIEPVTLEYLPRGHDYHAGLYRVVGAKGAVYLLKVNSRPVYESAFRVPHFLQAYGIVSVVASIPTQRHALWTTLERWTVSLYPFIEGDTSLTTMTGAQWKETGTIFQRIHSVSLPPTGFESLRTERFDSSGYASWIAQFESEHLHARRRGSDAEQRLHTSWMAHRHTIHTAMIYLERLASAIQSHTIRTVICHADLHAANLLRKPVGAPCM